MTSRGPSARTPEEFVGRLRDIVTANAEGGAKLVTRLGDFVRSVSQELRDERPGDRTDAEALLTRWLEFNLASFSAVSAQGLALFDDLLSAAENTLVPSGPGSRDVPPAPASRVELQLTGRRGERAATGFVIENKFDHSLSVSCVPTDLVPASGEPMPAALVTFDPAKLALVPRGQGVVNISVTITDDFVVGETYFTTIRLLGFEGKELGLSVTVLAGDGGSVKKPVRRGATSRKTPAKSRASTKTRKPAKRATEPIRLARRPAKSVQKRKPRARK